MTGGSPMSTETVFRYLDDVAQMLGEADPAYRAEVLAGVHDHLEAALGPRPWREDDVQQALDQLGPPEEIAEAALIDGQQPVPEPPPASLARAWVPPVAVATLAIGLVGVLWLFSRFYAFYPGMDGQVLVSVPEPFSFLRGFLWLLVLPTTWLVILGALLVTISPLYRTADRLAAWLAVPWSAAVFDLATFTLQATDPCVRTGSSCTGVDPQTARMAVLAALTVAAIGAVLLLVRLGRGRTMSRRAATRWWTATAVALGLLASALPVVLLPLTFREGTYVSHGVDGFVAYPWTFTDTLMPVLVILPVWIVTLVVLVRSPLWTRATKIIGTALLPALLVAASAVTVAPATLSPAVHTAGTAVSVAGAATVVITAIGIFLSGQKTTQDERRAGRLSR